MATKPATIVNSKGKTLYLSESGKSYSAQRTPEVSYKLTNTKGEKVTGYSDGTKQVIPRTNKSGGATEPTVLSTTNARENFQTKIQPIIEGANKLLTDFDTYKKEQAALASGATKEELPDAILSELESEKSEEQKLNDTLISSLNRQADAAEKAYDDMAVASRRAARAQVASIKAELSERRAMMEESNKANFKTWQQQFTRTGQAEYSPGMTQDFLSAKEREGEYKVKELESQYAVKVDEVNAALESKEYSIAAEKANEIREIENKIQETVTKNLKEIQTRNKEMREKQEVARRDQKIVELMGSGITDPMELYTELSTNGDLGDFTFSELLGVVAKVTSLQDKEAKAKGGTEASYSYEGDGYDITDGFDFGKGKMADVKTQVRKMFPGTFGQQLIVELNDEELREFMLWYSQESNDNQQNLDPEMALVEWAKDRGIEIDGSEESDDVENPF